MITGSKLTGDSVIKNLYSKLGFGQALQLARS